MNGLLVDTAQRTLTRLSIADQAYGYMQSLVPEASIEDFIVSNNLLPLGSLFYVLFCVTKGGWGWDNFLAEADTGKGVKFPAWSTLWLKFGIPALIIIIFVMGYVPKFATWLGLS